MSVLIGIALTLVALLVVALVTPVDLSLHLVREDERSSYHFGIGWLFGLVETELEAGGPDTARERSAEADSPPRRRAKRSGRRPRIFAMLRARGFVRGALRLLSRLGHAVRLRHASVWARAGFEDPADTGFLCAVTLPALSMLPRRWSRRIDVAPDFTGEMLTYDMRGQIRVVPVRLVAPFVLFGLSPSTIRAIYALATGRVT